MPPSGATTGVVERYDLRRDRWTRVAPIPQPVNRRAVLGDAFYALAGRAAGRAGGGSASGRVL